jgi:PKD repeat protein
MRGQVLLVAALALATVGCGDSGKRNAAPTAAFTVDCVDLTCSFADASSDTDGEIRSRAWNFGDGGASSDAAPTHTFAVPGGHTVTLTVADSDGASATHSREVRVNQPPRASFDFTCAGLTCAFRDGSLDAGGRVVAHRWTFGDGATSVAPDPSHTFLAAGTYPVGLTVTDDGGRTHTTTRSVVVAAPVPGTSPTAQFDVTCSSSVCTFTDRSTDDGAITGWSWSFGDGATSTAQNPVHTYPVAALTEVTVQLTVTDDAGATSVASRSFDVSPPAGLQCLDATQPGGRVGCALRLSRASRIQIELTSRECDAFDTTFVVTAPVQQTLFTDGCYAPALGTVFTLSDRGAPFPAGTVIAGHMISGSTKQVLPPTLIIEGTASPWTLRFDDGEVSPPDLDIVLTIREVP